jgi:glutaredoxin
VNVEADHEKLTEMLACTGGKMQVPVIVEGEKVRIGFAGNASLPQGLPLFGGT